MASNASQIPQSFLLLVLILPYLPTSRAPQISVIGNTDALTTEFAPEDYVGIDWTRLLGYYIPHLTTGKRYGPTWQYGYDIKHSYSTNVVKPRTYI